MSSQSGSTQGGDSLFQNMDEQEQVYAPQQVPGADMPAAEVDQGGTAGNTFADGSLPVTPVVPVRPDASINTPIVAPTGSTRDADDGDATGSARS